VNAEPPSTTDNSGEEGKEVPDEEIVYGYEIGRNSYVTLEKSEIREARPETSDTIRLKRSSGRRRRTRTIS